MSKEDDIIEELKEIKYILTELTRKVIKGEEKPFRSGKILDVLDPEEEKAAKEFSEKVSKDLKKYGLDDAAKKEK